MLKNPYTDEQKLPEEELKTVYGPVSKADFSLVKQIKPDIGVVRSMIGHLWHKACNELRRQNINDFTHEQQFDEFVSGCHVISDAEYQQLIADSTNWQQHQLTGGSGRGRGFHDRTVGGSVQNKNAPGRRKSKTKGDNGKAVEDKSTDVQK